MRNLQIKETDDIFVRAGSSGVGIAFLKLIKAKIPNIRVVASIRKKDIEKRNKILSLGYDEVIFDNNNVLETEENFDKILDKKILYGTLIFVGTPYIIAIIDGGISARLDMDDYVKFLLFFPLAFFLNTKEKIFKFLKTFQP